MANLNEVMETISAQFRDLNGVHPGLWPIAPRLLSAVGLSVVVVVAGWFGYLSGQVDEINAGQQEEMTLRDAFKQKVQKSNSLDELKEQRKLVIQYVARMEKQLPSKSEMAGLLTDINQAGAGRGLTFSSFKPGQVVVRDYYAELPIEIKLTGNYHDLGEFVSDIAKLSRIVTLNNLTISNNKDSQLVLEVVAKTFRYLDPDEISAQAALKKGAKK
jgi:type IV pilus assembly protein PilO